MSINPCIAGVEHYCSFPLQSLALHVVAMFMYISRSVVDLLYLKFYRLLQSGRYLNTSDILTQSCIEAGGLAAVLCFDTTENYSVWLHTEICHYFLVFIWTLTDWKKTLQHLS